MDFTLLMGRYVSSSDYRVICFGFRDVHVKSMSNMFLMIVRQFHCADVIDMDSYESNECLPLG